MNIGTLKDSLDIEAVANRYTTLKREGSKLKGLCPLHDERTPSFVVNPLNQRFKCFGCGAGGDVVELIMQVENCSVQDVLRRHDNGTTVRIERVVQQAPATPIELTKYVANDVVFDTLDDYLHSGLLTFCARYFSTESVEAVVNSYFIGALNGATVFWQTSLSGRITNAKVQGYDNNGKRMGNPRHLYTSDDGYTARECFGTHLLQEDRYKDADVCIVEGEKNALFGALTSPHQIWIATGAATKSLPSDVVVYLQSKKVYLWPDLDDSGQNWISRLLDQLPNAVNCNTCYTKNDKGWDYADEVLLCLSDSLPPAPTPTHPFFIYEPAPTPAPVLKPVPLAVPVPVSKPMGIGWAKPSKYNKQQVYTPPVIDDTDMPF